MSLHFKSSNKGKGGVNGKGFYIALGVCLIAIGVAAWTTYDSVVKFANPKENTSSSVTASNSAKPTEKNVSGVGKPESNVSSQAPAVSKPESKPSSSAPAKQTNTTPQKAVSYSFPVSQTVNKQFSGDNLVYSDTLKEWSVHSGTDFSAQVADPIYSIADGKVISTTKDSRYGNVVVIQHDGDVVASYCGVGDTFLVKKGDTVKAGQKIGSVGTVQCELVDKPHLHLEIKKSGKLIDPMSILTSKR